MTPRSSRRSLVRRFRSRVEHYTPDGALGRWLLGSGVGTVGLWFFALAFFDGTLSIFVSVLLLGLAAPLLLFAGLVLWPVYLSLIGNLESPDAYSVGDGTTAEPDTASETGGEDPLEVVKRRYANGEITEAEFEHRLENLLEVDSVERSGPDANGSRTKSNGSLDERERSIE
ncbi:SHOCT domain-containing protein [Natronorubrum sp. FCH18a]|uniref:SHOCT domain-containing protein n=1 Tax=Natronorubrum sp. FCH18a TaxID=3447018 RepID=UPI003F51900D